MPEEVKQMFAVNSSNPSRRLYENALQKSRKQLPKVQESLDRAAGILYSDDVDVFAAEAEVLRLKRIVKRLELRMEEATSLHHATIAEESGASVRESDRSAASDGWFSRMCPAEAEG